MLYCKSKYRKNRININEEPTIYIVDSYKGLDLWYNGYDYERFYYSSILHLDGAK